MRDTLQQVINGLAAGGVIALFALGFTLLFGVLEIINLAHGAILAIGAFVGWYFIASLGLPLGIALAAAAVSGAIVGAMMNLVGFRPLRRRRRTELSALIVSLGLLLLVNSAIQIASETRVYTFPARVFSTKLYDVGGLIIPQLQMYILVASFTLAAAMFAFLRYSKPGKGIRVLAWRPEVAQSLGIPVERIIMYTFMIASALAGVAGVLVGLAFNYVYFDMGTPYLLQGIAAVILGGLGNIAGAFLGALAIGVAGALTAQYAGSQMVDIVTFSMIFALLIVRPHGLLGARAGREV